MDSERNAGVTKESATLAKDLAPIYVVSEAVGGL